MSKPSCFIFALAAFAGAQLFAGAQSAAAESTRSFKIAAGDAIDTLKDFVDQSGDQVVYPPNEVRGVQTNAVTGELTPLAALTQMLSGTMLSVLYDEGTGALAVRRDSTPNGQGVVPAAATAPTQPRANTELVQLNPFEVQADSDKSYGAINSNSITAFNTALDHLPISADIFDQAFMNDVGGTTVESMIQSYSAGAGMDFNGASPSTNQPGDRVSNAFLQLRGHMSPTEDRDSLLNVGTIGNAGSSSIGATNNFDVERVEIINGPQALLYDNGGAGGVVNIVSKQARLGAPAFGSFSFAIDEWGTKYATLDYGASRGNVALRVAVVNGDTDTRRTNIGDTLSGAYVQGAWRVANTTFRMELEQTKDWRLDSVYQNMTSTSGDPLFAYNGVNLDYILASGNGGAIDNGHLNWADRDSTWGVWASDSVVDEFVTFSADTQWTSWLSTQFSAGYSDFFDDHAGEDSAATLYSPGATSNPIPGNWTMGYTGSASLNDKTRPNRNKSARFSLLATNELFGGRAHSQTILGVDYVGDHQQILSYGYYQADSNWNTIYTPSITANVGRTIIPKPSWTINNGPIEYALFNPGAPRITYNGLNYNRELNNPTSTAITSVTNPEGTEIANGLAGTIDQYINDGIYAINYTQWMNGKLDTLVGARLEHAYWWGERTLYSPPSQYTYEAATYDTFNFNVGADYHLLPWLAPYFSVSDAYLVPPDGNPEPDGTLIPDSHGLSEEVGLKVTNSDGKISGSIAFYHDDEKNAEFFMSSSLAVDINPSGLNGHFNAMTSTAFAADSTSNGLQATLTANPTKSWRMRLSAAVTAGKYGSNVTYPQLYNDQFYENSSGQVTYADGSVVYVPAAYNSKQLTVTSATAGAVPLTTTLLSTPSSSYFASPQPVSGVIQATSNGAKVLDVVDPVHGSILTGKAGLPITAYQLNPALAGITIPGSISPALSGQDTVGNPLYSMNFTSVYELPSGWLKGFNFGGTLSASWQNRSYYYYPNGIGSSGPNGSPQVLFQTPDVTQFDLILGYNVKLHKIGFSSRLNVYNLFNHYDVVIYPDPITGYTVITGLKANLSQQPRSFRWTNTISF